MATLEKIRSKSVFLIVVIGVALLAFIVGDALTNSRNIFGDHTTVAKVGNVKIDYTDYQRKREELNNQLEEARRNNPEQMAGFDTQILPQMAVEQLVQEALILDAADKAGIRSTGNLLRFYMLENPRNPEVLKVMRQLNAAGIGVQTPQQAYDVIFNPKRNGLTDAQVEPFQRAWLAAEKATGKLIQQQTYQRLLAGTVVANDLDKKALYNDYVATANVDVVFKPFGQLDEKQYPVSDSEISSKYNELKEMFKVSEPTKEVSFIAVNVLPSQEDQAKSKDLASKTVASLTAGSLSKELKKEGVNVVKHNLRGVDLPAGAIKDFVTAGGDSAKVKLISDNIQGFTAIKVLGRNSQVDSIQVNIVSVATEPLSKRVLAALNGGLAVDSVMTRFSMDSVNTQLKEWLPLYTADGPTNVLPQAQLDSLMQSAGKFITLQSGAQGTLLAQLVEQKAPVTIYEYEEATYTLSPSQKTRNDERAKFEKFLGANNTPAKFTANAEKAGYNVQQFALTSSTPAVPRFRGMDQYYPDSRQVVRWVMIDGEKGEVSHIYNSQDPVHPAMYAVAIDDSYNEYVPVSNKEVRDELASRVRAEKAGDKMVAQYGKNLETVEGAAKAMGVEVRNIPTFRMAPGAGVADNGVNGAIAGTKADKKAKTMKGRDGVYVYRVNSVGKENFPYNEQMYGQQYFQVINPDLVKMLMGTKELKNNVYKFEAGD